MESCAGVSHSRSRPSVVDATTRFWAPSALSCITTMEYASLLPSGETARYAIGAVSGRIGSSVTVVAVRLSSSRISKNLAWLSRTTAAKNAPRLAAIAVTYPGSVAVAATFPVAVATTCRVSCDRSRFGIGGPASGPVRGSGPGT